MAHPHIEASDPNLDPTFNARLKGDVPAIDDTEGTEDTVQTTEAPVTEHKLTVVEKMQKIKDFYGFIPLSDAETSLVYSIGSRQNKDMQPGQAVRVLLQNIHRHQMYNQSLDTSAAVRAKTHQIQEIYEGAGRRQHFTAEFDEFFHEEGATVGAKEDTVRYAFHDGQAIQFARGPLVGMAFVREYTEQMNKMAVATEEDPVLYPEDPMDLTVGQMEIILAQMKDNNRERVSFWHKVHDGAALHKMAHAGLKEAFALQA